MSKGKSITIDIPEGKTENTIEISMPTWDGLAFRIMRDNLTDAKTVDVLKQCGVYFLYGEQKDNQGKVVRNVYIGQGVTRKNGEGVLFRIKEHDKAAEDYWTEAIAFVDTKNYWGKTEISYLENRFTNLVQSCHNDYFIRNNNDPNPGNVTKAKQWELGDYIDGAILILKVLGYKFFDKADENFQSDKQTLVSGKKTTAEPKKQRQKKLKMLELKEDAYCRKCSPDVIKRYKQLKDDILKWKDVELKTTGVYIGFYVHKKLFSSISILSSKIRLFANLKKGQLNDKDGITRDVAGIGHWGPGDYEIPIEKTFDKEKILNVIWQAYRAKL